MGKQSSIMSFFGPPKAKPMLTPAQPRRLSTAVPDTVPDSSSPDSDSPMSPIFPAAGTAKRTLFDGDADADTDIAPCPRPSKARCIVVDDGDDDDEVDDDQPIRVKQSRMRVSSRVSPFVADLGDDDEPILPKSLKLSNGFSTPKKRLTSPRHLVSAEDYDEADGSTPLCTFAFGQTVVDSVKNKVEARQKLGKVDLSGGAGQDEYAEKNPWSVDIRDAKRRCPGDESYDPDTLYIPASVLDKMSPFQRQYWEVKSKHYSKVLLVRKGAFMEAYDIDADIVHKELGLNYTGGGRVCSCLLATMFTSLCCGQTSLF
jgi:MutS domain I